jgi:hypothetical protein
MKVSKQLRIVHLRTHAYCNTLHFTTWTSVFDMGPEEHQLIASIVKLLDEYDRETERRADERAAAEKPV